MRIVCTGSIALDTTRTPFKTMEKTLGGAGVFFSWASSFFASTSLVGAVGRDFPPSHKQSLVGKGIGFEVEEREGKTFFIDWTYDYHLSDRKVNVLEMNVLADYSPLVPERLRSAEFAYAGTLKPLQQLAFVRQFSSAKFTAMDSISYYLETEPDNVNLALKSFDCVFLNDFEARMLAKTPSLVRAGREILKLGPRFVVVKKGEHGAILFTKEKAIPFPAFPLEEVVDPTGAGDSFAGGFIGSLASDGEVSEKALRRAMAYGQVMGSFCVEDFGLERLKSLTLKEIGGRFQEYVKLLGG